MIERLSGVFRDMRKVSNHEEFVSIVRECANKTNGSVCRLHVYPSTPASQVILILYVRDGRVYYMGFDPSTSSFVVIEKESVKDMIAECYVEVYHLTHDHISVDMDVIEHAARVKGLDRLLTEALLEEFLDAIAPPNIAGVAGREPAASELRAPPRGSEKKEHPTCDIIIREVIDSFSSAGISETLSKHLSNPSTIAKILLYSEEYVIATKECKELLSYLEKIIGDKDYVAVKLEVGDYSIWLVRSGESAGMHDFLGGRPASSGLGVVEHWEDVKKLLNGALKGRQRVNVYIYTLRKDTFKK